jgi:predicted RND superfamily exporter protein
MLAYEYREHIVRRLQGYDSKEPAAVYFIGYQPENGVDESGNPNDHAAQVDQTSIFVNSLSRLLKIEGYKSIGISSAEMLRSVNVKPTDMIIELQDVPGITTQALNATRAFRLDAKNHEFYPYSDATARDRGQKVSVVYTGLVPIVYKAQRTLLTSLIQSTGLAFVMIAGVMILLLRSLRAGLISMFPNVFPVIVVFGYLGLREFKVDIGSMMTASVAMGVAVDDTIHFLSWFRKGLDDGHDRKASILLAYRRVATAMTQTTAIGGIGLSIFAFSTFTPTQQFGTLMLALLVAALVGDLFFLPALLASSLGKVFDKKKDDDGSDPEQSLSKGSVSIPHIEGSRTGRANPSKREQGNLPPGMRRDESH